MPVCLNPGANRDFRSKYAERLGFNCPQCGPFIVTSTAAAMLPRRLPDDPEGRIRLSHQARLAAGPGALLTINSENLDELLSRPLPAAIEQMNRFLDMVSLRLGDDHYGSVRFSDVMILTAIATVGAKSVGSMRRLIDSAIEEKLIGHTIVDGGWEISLTASGRARLNPAATLTPAPQTTSDAVQRRPKPLWVAALPDNPLRHVLDEVYAAMDAGMLALPLMGARTAFDRSMFLTVGDPKGGFQGKLSAMKSAGRLDDREITILQPMIDAASAAAHRGWLPTPEVVAAVMDELEHKLRDWFVREDAAAGVRAATPPRR